MKKDGTIESMDAVNTTENDVTIKQHTRNDLSELDAEVNALQQLGDDLPKVARSVPRELARNTANWPTKSLAHCLLPSSAYDDMLHDSLDMVHSLENNLDSLINQVRSGNTPVMGKKLDSSQLSATVKVDPEEQKRKVRFAEGQAGNDFSTEMAVL